MKAFRFILTLCTMTIIALSYGQTKQQGKETKSATGYKMTTDIPPSITTPDSVKTSLGTLGFFDGFPDDATVKKVYDYLDLQRGVQVFLTSLPAAWSYVTHAGFLTYGNDNQTVLLAESLLDSHSLILTANTETVYCNVWLNTKDGPVVIEVPPHVLGVIDDSWDRYVADVGNAGPDRGKGGKYLLLPPGYKGEVPEGYFVTRSRTYGNLMFCRGFIINGDLRPAVENFKKNLHVYPLSMSANQPAMKFVNISGASFNMVYASDASFFDQIAAVVREEPLEAVDPETRGLLASIGIRKDKSFSPDARMKGILADAAAIGNAAGRTIAFSTRDPDAYIYPDSRWKECWVGNDHEFSPGGVLNPDSRTLYFYPAFGISPALTAKMIGLGSHYITTEHDAAGHYLDGSKTYRLNLPPNVPAKDFWSLTVYDPQTRSMLQTDQRFPSAGSQKKDLIINPDKSVDVWFGPQPPSGREVNWIQTIPGKGFWLMLRLYGPLEPWFDKTWRPGEVELVK